MAPASYRPRLKIDDEKKRTYTQSEDTNLSGNGRFARVAQLLEHKGDAVHAVAPGDTIQFATEQLKAQKIGAILVMEHGKLAGILSERDVVGALAEAGAKALDSPVSEIMTPEPQICAPSDPLLVVTKRMSDGGFRHMPVADINGNVVGVLSLRDVVAFRLRELEYEALQMKQMITG